MNIGGGSKKVLRHTCRQVSPANQITGQGVSRSHEIAIILFQNFHGIQDFLRDFPEIRIERNHVDH
jgi:hypothetical protein